MIAIPPSLAMASEAVEVKRKAPKISTGPDYVYQQIEINSISVDGLENGFRYFDTKKEFKLTEDQFSSIFMRWISDGPNTRLRSLGLALEQRH